MGGPRPDVIPSKNPGIALPSFKQLQAKAQMGASNIKHSVGCPGISWQTSGESLKSICCIRWYLRGRTAGGASRMFILSAQEIPNVKIINAGLHNFPIWQCDNFIHGCLVGVSPSTKAWFPVHDRMMAWWPTNESRTQPATNFLRPYSSLSQVLNPEP